MANKINEPLKYRLLASLIPGGPLQFLDLRFKINGLKILPTEFYEYQEQDTYIAGKSRPIIKFLQKDNDNEGYIDKQTRKTIKDPYTNLPKASIKPTYSFNINNALEPFIDKWVPLPFMRTCEIAGSIDSQYCKGPTDWARAKISLLEKPDAQGNTHQLTIAFDTKLEPGLESSCVDPALVYPSLSETDLKDKAEYHLISDVKHNLWFLELNWVNDWLHEFFNEFTQNKKIIVKGTSNYPYRFEHQARYISFLECLTTLNIVPNICLTDLERYPCIDVDLILDIGNSRSVGMLVERQPGENLSFSNSSILELRDLSDPRNDHKNIFSLLICASPKPALVIQMVILAAQVDLNLVLIGLQSFESAQKRQDMLYIQIEKKARHL
jgi:hypothetical protein